jgi:hypothetical protein
MALVHPVVLLAGKAVVIPLAVLSVATDELAPQLQ